MCRCSGRWGMCSVSKEMWFHVVPHLSKDIVDGIANEPFFTCVVSDIVHIRTTLTYIPFNPLFLRPFLKLLISCKSSNTSPSEWSALCGGK